MMISLSFCADKLADALLDRAYRDKRRAEVGDRVLMRLADIEDEEIFLCVQLVLQLLDGDLRDTIDDGMRRRQPCRVRLPAGRLSVGLSMPQNWS